MNSFTTKDSVMKIFNIANLVVANCWRFFKRASSEKNKKLTLSSNCFFFPGEYQFSSSSPDFQILIKILIVRGNPSSEVHSYFYLILFGLSENFCFILSEPFFCLKLILSVRAVCLPSSEFQFSWELVTPMVSFVVLRRTFKYYDNTLGSEVRSTWNADFWWRGRGALHKSGLFFRANDMLRFFWFIGGCCYIKMNKF